MLGITDKEFAFLTEEEQQKLLRANLGGDAQALALKGLNPVICRQLKALEKCKEKLPHYYEALCVIPPTSLEQASSTYTTRVKEYSGNSLLDLTCGLGGDTSHFATRFARVTSLERDPLLAKIAEYNFKQLGIGNINVINSDAQTFLNTYDGAPFDVIYCDPARRDETRRTFLPEDCSPDILSLLEEIKRHTSKLVVKLSPLFDTEEIFRLFSGYGVTVEAVSYDGECKEVIAEIAFGGTDEKIVNTVIAKNGDFRKYTFPHEKSAARQQALAEYEYIYLADVSFKKHRNTRKLLDTCFTGVEAFSEESTVFSKSVIPAFPGRGYHILESSDYKPKTLKKTLRERGIKGATIIKGDASKPIAEIRKALSLQDGDQATLLAACGKLYFVETL